MPDNKRNIAVFPRDRIGKEVTPEGVRVLNGAAAKYDLARTRSAPAQKAFTSASLGRDTAGLAGFIGGNPENGGLRDMDSRLGIQASALPIRIGGSMFGEIGVGGAPSGASTKLPRVLALTPSVQGSRTFGLPPCGAGLPFRKETKNAGFIPLTYGSAKPIYSA